MTEAEQSRYIEDQSGMGLDLNSHWSTVRDEKSRTNHPLLHALVHYMPKEGEQLTVQQRAYWLRVLEVNLEAVYPPNRQIRPMDTGEKSS